MTANSSEAAVKHIPGRAFEIALPEGHARLMYRMLSDTDVEMYHTEVPAELAGRGIGSALATAALDWARSGNLHVRATCSFVKAHIAEHPEYEDLTSASGANE